MYVGWIYRSDSPECTEQQQNVFVASILHDRVHSASKIQTPHSVLLFFVMKMECTPRYLSSTTKRSSKSAGGVGIVLPASPSSIQRLSSRMKSCCRVHLPLRWIFAMETQCMWNWICHPRFQRFWKEKNRIWQCKYSENSSFTQKIRDKCKHHLF